MINPELRAKLISESQSTLTPIWAAICGSVLLFGAVAKMTTTPTTPNEVIVDTLYGISVVVAVVSVLVRRSFLSPKKLLSGPAAARDHDSLARSAAARFRTGSIIGFALAESVALYGLTCAKMSGVIEHYYALGGASLMLLVFVHRPKAADLDEAFKQLDSGGPHAV